MQLRFFLRTLSSLLLCATTFASTGKTVHSFESLANGANPQSNVIADSAGNLYGTTYFGGVKNVGSVFELSPNSNGGYTQTVLYSFTGGSNDGSYPASGLTMDSAGNLYGTTGGGGSSTFCGGAGCGTVYKLSRKSGGGWTASVLFIFTGLSTGVLPTAGVILDSAGNLYGAAGAGGYSGYGNGLIFKLSPASPTWTETILYSFTGGSDGAFPTTTPVFDAAGNLYGSTLSAAGGYYGVAYELSPGASGWTEKVIHTFNGYPLDVGTPLGPMIFDSAGNLYGAAAGGGTCSSNGAVFELSPSTGGNWTEKQLYCFGGGGSQIDGQVPEGTIAFDSSGNLYGTTFEGGSLGYGTVWQLVPKSGGGWSEHVIKNFTNGNDGGTPKGGVAFDSSGFLYATAYAGSSSACLFGNYGGGGCGTVIKLTPRTGGAWPSTTISRFTSTDSAFPVGGLIADGLGNYYGTASQGGAYGAGEVFKLSAKNGSWSKTVLYDFTGNLAASNNDGLYPSGNLVFDNAGNLYGTTQVGGNGSYCSNYAPGCGIVFELSPTQKGPWTEKILYQFDSPIGGLPTSGLIFDGAGNLYGTTQQGGLNYCNLGPCGMVYKLSPGTGGTWTETTLYQFTGGNDGGNPAGGLVMDKAGNLYGASNNAGADYGGTAFELTPSGGTWTFNVIHTFGSVDGDAYYPQSGYVIDSSGNLYGTAYGPTGTLDGGAVYELSPATGQWNTTVLHAFTPHGDGAGPAGGVIFDSAGNLYGTTQYGGSSANCNGGCGTIFSLSPSGSGWTEKVLHSFTGNGDGSAPVASVVLDSNGNVFTTASTGGGGRQGTVFEFIP